MRKTIQVNDMVKKKVVYLKKLYKFKSESEVIQFLLMALDGVQVDRINSILYILRGEKNEK